MIRLLCSTAILSALPFAAAGQDMVLRADITQAVVNAYDADITREASVTLPAGETTLFIALPDVATAELLQISGPEGVRFSPPDVFAGVPLTDGQLDDAAQAAARAALTAAEEALLATQDEIAQAETAIRAVEAQQRYLDALTQGVGGVTMPEDPARVAEFLATLGAETQRVAEELAATRSLRRSLDEDLAEAEEARNAARVALARLRPFETSTRGIEVIATAEEEIEADLQITYRSDDAYWWPSYDLRLDSETGGLTIARYITLSLQNETRWQDVAVTFSTADPSGEREPSVVTSRPARIHEEQARFSISSGAMEAAPAPLRDAAMPEPVVMIEERAAVTVDGLALSYVYTQPVSVGPTREVLLPFDDLVLDMETENRAAPRFDDTAFLIAMGENDTGEPILPGEARFFRDGALIGEDEIDLIPAGAEMELAFGSLDHLQLVWIDRSNAEGDEGFLFSSNTQERELTFGVENIGNTAESVRVVYAVPFAEQEDLEMEVRLSRAPDETNVDDRRGVQAWEVEVAPGATELIEMEVEFSWPEDQELDWRP